MLTRTFFHPTTIKSSVRRSHTDDPADRNAAFDAPPPSLGAAIPRFDWSLGAIDVVPGFDGSPLATHEREGLERSFDEDLGDVRLHESSLPRALGTEALSVGRHVVFAPGARQADASNGGDVLAHEVAHIVQRGGAQSSAEPDPASLSLDLDAAHEAAADAAARLAVRGEPARGEAANGGAPPSDGAVQLYGGESDYLRDVVRGGAASHPPTMAPLYASDGPNDALMAPKSNPLSDAVNWGVSGLMDMIGYDTRQRPVTEDNDFYRDYAKYMPGFDIDGVPSGAWAQNAATNHVGHGTAPGNPWDNVRRSLVDQEKSMIDSDLAGGGTGELSYWDVYDAHVNAYDTSGGGGNRFIDPGSFALAVYGAPLLEAAGIDSGPITGASIDIFNNPEDSRTEGWAKRMGLAGAEIGGGAALASSGVGQILSGSPLTGAASIAGGGAMAGLGAFGGVWNTATAIEGGMLDDWKSSIFGP